MCNYVIEADDAFADRVQTSRSPSSVQQRKVVRKTFTSIVRSLEGTIVCDLSPPRILFPSTSFKSSRSPESCLSLLRNNGVPSLSAKVMRVFSLSSDCRCCRVSDLFASTRMFISKGFNSPAHLRFIPIAIGAFPSLTHMPSSLVNTFTSFTTLKVYNFGTFQRPWYHIANTHTDLVRLQFHGRPKRKRAKIPRKKRAFTRLTATPDYIIIRS